MSKCFPTRESGKKKYFRSKMNQVHQTTLLSIIVAVLGSVIIYAIKPTKEQFWMTPSRTWKVDKMFRDPNDTGCSKNDFFATPNFQSILSPRFSNVDYGPDLRTQFPSYNRLGVPYDPLAEGSVPPDPLNSLKEGFSNPGWTGETVGWQNNKYIGPDKIPLDPHNAYSGAYANGNYDQVLAEIVQKGADGWPTSTVEELNTATFMNADGEMKQPIIYDRYIYPNRNSRLRGQGDPIRGDLPIVPISGSWFIPSGAFEGPNVVLQQGAMNVMGGVNNETSNQLANLIYNSSGGAETTIGGVDMAKTNMSHSVYGAVSAAQGDVRMTAFP